MLVLWSVGFTLLALLCGVFAPVVLDGWLRYRVEVSGRPATSRVNRLVVVLVGVMPLDDLALIARSLPTTMDFVIAVVRRLSTLTLEAAIDHGDPVAAVVGRRFLAASSCCAFGAERRTC